MDVPVPRYLCKNFMYSMHKNVKYGTTKNIEDAYLYSNNTLFSTAGNAFC
jgi:hypothetical protein